MPASFASPSAFFQHNPTGRLISTTINDVERARFALSEWLADLFQKSFTLICLPGCAARHQLENGAGLRCLAAFGRVAQSNKFGRKNSPLRGEQPDAAWAT